MPSVGKVAAALTALRARPAVRVVRGPVGPGPVRVALAVWEARRWVEAALGAWAQVLGPVPVEGIRAVETPAEAAQAVARRTAR